MNPLVILDRDGVINADSAHYITQPSQWQPLAGSLEAVSLLTQAGYRVVVVSNQSAVARDLCDSPTLQAIHHKMYRYIEQAGGHLYALWYCPHDDSAQCPCRKPKPGMLEQCRERLAVDSFSSVAAIGDSRRDLQAYQAIGARAMLVLSGNGMATQTNGKLEGVEVFDTLLTAAQQLVLEAALAETEDTEGTAE